MSKRGGFQHDFWCMCCFVNPEFAEREISCTLEMESRRVGTSGTIAEVFKGARDLPMGMIQS